MKYFYKGDNQLLHRAINKYDDIEVEKVFSGSVDQCLEEEKRLRPSKRIGWNLAEGGGMPPVHTGDSSPMRNKNIANKVHQYLKNNNKLFGGDLKKNAIKRKQTLLERYNTLSTSPPPPSQAGTKWWNNGKENKRSRESPGSDWVSGRMAFKHYGEDKQCPHCGKIGKGSGMTQFHFDKCKEKI